MLLYVGSGGFLESPSDPCKKGLVITHGVMDMENWFLEVQKGAAICDGLVCLAPLAPWKYWGEV